MRKLIKPALVVLLAMAILLTMVACTTPTTAATKQKDSFKIGIANFIGTSPYFVGMPKAIEREAARYKNITCVSTDAGMDTGKLTTDIQNLINQGIDGLIVSAGPSETLPAALDAIERSKIPTVFVDRLWKNTNLTQPWNWVGAPNTKMGQEIGEYIKANYLKADSKILIIKGGPADNSIGIDRTNGFLQGVGLTMDQVRVAPDFGNWAVDGGMKACAPMLVKYPDTTIVFAENDSMALGAMQAIKDAHLDKQIVVCATDAGKDCLKEMMNPDSIYVCTAVNDSDEIGTRGFYNLMAIWAGIKVDQQTPTEGQLITKDTAWLQYNPNSVF